MQIPTFSLSLCLLLPITIVLAEDNAGADSCSSRMQGRSAAPEPDPVAQWDLEPLTAVVPQAVTMVPQIVTVVSPAVSVVPQAVTMVQQQNAQESVNNAAPGSAAGFLGGAAGWSPRKRSTEPEAGPVAQVLENDSDHGLTAFDHIGGSRRKERRKFLDGGFWLVRKRDDTTSTSSLAGSRLILLPAAEANVPPAAVDGTVPAVPSMGLPPRKRSAAPDAEPIAQPDFTSFDSVTDTRVECSRIRMCDGIYRKDLVYRRYCPCR